MKSKSNINIFIITTQIRYLFYQYFMEYLMTSNVTYMNLIPLIILFFYSSVKFNLTLFYYLFTKPPCLISFINFTCNDVEKFKDAIIIFFKTFLTHYRYTQKVFPCQFHLQNEYHFTFLPIPNCGYTIFDMYHAK